MVIMSYLRTIYREILYENIIKEIGEGSSVPFNYTKVNNELYKFNAEELTCRVDFQNYDDFDQKFKQTDLSNKYWNSNKTFNVGYKVNDNEFQFGKTNVKTLLRIISTVSKIVKDFIDDNQPDALYIVGNGKMEGDKDVKSNIYETFILKQINDIPNYSAAKRNSGYVVYNMSYKKK